jgi:hypothetical protein
MREVRIEPISNMAHGAKGPAYRISPEGLHTPVPMTLTFKVDAASLQGTSLDALAIATQGADGRWLASRTPGRDADAGTVSVQTTHFSDWGLIAGAQLHPATAMVAIEASLDLAIIHCPWVEDSAGTVQIDECKTESPSSAEASHWAVNGIDGGTSAVGTIAPFGDPAKPDAIQALFQAPAKVPAGNPVAVSVDYRDSPGASPVKLVSNITIVEDETCNWLHGATTLNFEVEMSYAFTGAGPLGHLTLDQRGLIIGEMTQQFDGAQLGVWRGLTTRGSAALSDQHTFGDVTSTLTGNGIPANGADALSAAQLVVDYTDCTYTITGQVAVLASAGGNDEPTEKNVAGFTRGKLPIDMRVGLAGREDMPPRLQPDPAGTFFPGGLGIGLVGDGYANQENAGKGKVRWVVTK